MSTSYSGLYRRPSWSVIIRLSTMSVHLSISSPKDCLGRDALLNSQLMASSLEPRASVLEMIGAVTLEACSFALSLRVLCLLA
ncbi:hypothetical protein L1987_12386 [Smallanthus sonchifolius]|uniref:Uncharacterized protein n=1 Tax=Smallanthus sonchifolius TaxID=185202 RepID=A0ACB9JDM1_9ASTR|nr:hypothetical protein L1987_12386 [Smallanthus sonchifolius]